jgi:nucleotide-binding universal stress UspA family protein
MPARSGHPRKTILLATDFQSPARKAFSHAVALAAVLHARLVILHVIKAAARPHHASGSGGRYLGTLKTAAMLELGRLARIGQEADLQAEVSLLSGSPAASILEEAAKLQPELIVMGTHGRVGWDRLRLGSTAETVVRKASCPVLTLHDMVPGDTFRHPVKVRMSRLLLATDLSSSAPAIARYTAHLAEQLEASLLMLHVAEEGGRSHAARPAVVTDRRVGALSKDRRRQRLERLVSTIRLRDLPVESHCVAGPPVETILSEAARWEANLVIVGTAGRRGLSRLVLGSVAEGVIRRAGCPLLVVPAVAVRSLRDGRDHGGAALQADGAR